MKAILLSQEQFNLFMDLAKNCSDIIFCQDKDTIFIDDINREKVIDLLSDYFVQRGIDRKYEPNSFGKRIESLMDKFISV